MKQIVCRFIVVFLFCSIGFGGLSADAPTKRAIDEAPGKVQPWYSRVAETLGLKKTVDVPRDIQSWLKKQKDTISDPPQNVREWLGSDDGRKWLETNEGKDWRDSEAGLSYRASLVREQAEAEAKKREEEGSQRKTEPITPPVSIVRPTVGTMKEPPALGLPPAYRPPLPPRETDAQKKEREAQRKAAEQKAAEVEAQRKATEPVDVVFLKQNEEAIKIAESSVKIKEQALREAERSLNPIGKTAKIAAARMALEEAKKDLVRLNLAREDYRRSKVDELLRRPEFSELAEFFKEKQRRVSLGRVSLEPSQSSRVIEQVLKMSTEDLGNLSASDKLALLELASERAKSKGTKDAKKANEDVVRLTNILGGEKSLKIEVLKETKLEFDRLLLSPRDLSGEVEKKLNRVIDLYLVRYTGLREKTAADRVDGIKALRDMYESNPEYVKKLLAENVVARKEISKSVADTSKELKNILNSKDHKNVIKKIKQNRTKLEKLRLDSDKTHVRISELEGIFKRSNKQEDELRQLRERAGSIEKQQSEINEDSRVLENSPILEKEREMSGKLKELQLKENLLDDQGKALRFVSNDKKYKTDLDNVERLAYQIKEVNKKLSAADRRSKEFSGLQARFLNYEGLSRTEDRRLADIRGILVKQDLKETDLDEYMEKFKKTVLGEALSFAEQAKRGALGLSIGVSESGARAEKENEAYITSLRELIGKYESAKTLQGKIDALRSIEEFHEKRLNKFNAELLATQREAETSASKAQGDAERNKKLQEQGGSLSSKLNELIP